MVKKILIFAEYPLSSLGDLYMREGCSWLPPLSEQFSKFGEFEIHWAILSKSTRNFNVLEAHNQYFHLVPFWGLTLSLLTLRLRELLQFRKLIRIIQPDLIHCWGTEQAYSACLFATSKPRILSIQGIIGAFWKVGKFKGWHWKILKLLEPYSIKRANVITCESEWSIEHINKIFNADKPHKVDYGVHEDFYKIKWDPDYSKPYFVLVGSLDYRKGVDILLKMLQLYPKRKWDVHFVGAGPYTADLLKLKEHGVVMHGLTSPGDVPQIMSKALAFIMPTRADTGPTVVKEARVVGLPVIGTSNGGLRDLIKHGEDGYIIDSEDPHEWYQYLDELANDEQLCRKFGAVNHDHYRSILHPQLTADAFIKLYKQMLSHE